MFCMGDSDGGLVVFFRNARDGELECAYGTMEVLASEARWVLSF